MKNYKEYLEQYIELERQVLSSVNIDHINEIMNLLERARRDDKRIFICGNGGSASTASHFTCDFNRRKYNFECLNDNIPMMMAIANDISYNDIFSVQLQKKIKASDILIVISGSGNSENIIRAIKYAKEVGALTIGFVGFDGGKVKKMADFCIHIDVADMQITEDIHLAIEHAMIHTFCHLIDHEERL